MTFMLLSPTSISSPALTTAVLPSGFKITARLPTVPIKVRLPLLLFDNAPLAAEPSAEIGTAPIFPPAAFSRSFAEGGFGMPFLPTVVLDPELSPEDLLASIQPFAV